MFSRPVQITTLLISLYFPYIALAITAPSISIQPDHIIQGDPIMITIEGIDTVKNIKSVTFNSEPLPVFMYDNKPRAFYGADLKKLPGHYLITSTLTDGTVLTKDINIEARAKIEAPLGIPEKLGGNTEKSQTKLVSTLADENQSLLNLYTGLHVFWKDKFHYPISTPTVTDSYGYTRTTGPYTIAHKGTDFRAPIGTPVLAMNRGVVRIATTYRNYGKTVVVDHGLGLMTFYMHLSKINVAKDNLVTPGQVIGLSGDTGYAEKPHLHVSVRIKDVSIDPVVFMGFFK